MSQWTQLGTSSAGLFPYLKNITIWKIINPTIKAIKNTTNAHVKKIDNLSLKLNLFFDIFLFYLIFFYFNDIDSVIESESVDVCSEEEEVEEDKVKSQYVTEQLKL